MDRLVRSKLALALPLLTLLAMLPLRADALEAFDGRIEVHGFYEAQVRGLSRQFGEELDLSQWYNVINVEVELDILPDGWGPIDLLQAYIRGEGRYDCIYTGGCGMFPSVDTYGNHSQNLPLRLRDAIDEDGAGGYRSDDFAEPPGRPFRVPDGPRDPVGWAVYETVTNPLPEPGDDQGTSNTVSKDVFNPNLTANCPPKGPGMPSNVGSGCVDNRPTKQDIVKRRGFPGFDTLFDAAGADGELRENPDFSSLGPSFYDPDFDVDGITPGGGDTLAGTYGPALRGLAPLDDDPASYVFESVLDWKFTFRKQVGTSPNGTTLIMGPWLPRNFFQANAQLRDRANPLRAGETPVVIVRDEPVGTGGLPGPNSAMNRTGVGEVRYHALDALRGVVDPADVPWGIDPIDDRLLKLEQLSIKMAQSGIVLTCFADAPCQSFPGLQLGMYPQSQLFISSLGQRFGGDFSGVIPCRDTAPLIQNRAENFAQSDFIQQVSGFQGAQGCIPLTNIRVTGGLGELPMRVAPDLSNLAVGGPTQAQGLYIPSYGLVNTLGSRSLDTHQFNIDEDNRAWNRGSSQRDNYEFKEGYLDLEFLDSRLWIRLGIQNIVWGKTELFRTTDQFNPQDLSLATLGSLEETRVALLAGRAVYSLYDIGPLEDVRVELGINFDRFKPADLGGCGEPYTPDLVCTLTFGIAAHSLLGLGVAGVDRPESGWSDAEGLEYGGRIEFRWDRFSFAIIDFYGYSDFPYADPIFYFDRNSDVLTGRMRKANARGPCQNAAAFVATDPFGRDPAIQKIMHAGNAAIEFSPTATAAERAAARPTGYRTVFTDDGDDGNDEASGGLRGNAANDDYHRRIEPYSILGVGTDPDCLKPGGAPGFPNENRFDVSIPTYADFIELQGGTAALYSDPTTDEATAGTFVGQTLNQWTAEGESVDYALLHHPANQQIFQFICAATVSIAIALNPGACAWNIWGVPEDLAGTEPFSELVGQALAGSEAGSVSNFFSIVVSNTKTGEESSTGGLTFFPTTPINSDVRDGRTTAGSGGNRRNFLGGDLFLKSTARDVFDRLTLDNSLTMEQKALLGCGPFFGTRCDSGARILRVQIQNCTFSPGTDCGVRVAIDPTHDAFFAGQIDWQDEATVRENPARYIPVDAEGNSCIDGNPNTVDDLGPCTIYGRGGGIDFLNAEASVFVQSFPGIPGATEIGRTTIAADLAQPGTIGLVGIQGLPAGVAGYPEAERAAAPFVGAEYCMRFEPGNPLANNLGLVRLPGCRGATSATVNHDTQTVDVRFEDGYTPFQDGCVFGRKVVYRPNRAGADPGSDTRDYFVRPVDANGDLDSALNTQLLETCWNGLTNATIEGNAATHDPTNPNANPDFTYDNIRSRDLSWFSYSRRRVVRTSQEFSPRVEHNVGGNVGSLDVFNSPGALTLYHPFAQCEQAGVGVGHSQMPVAQRNTPVFDPTLANVCRFERRDFDSDLIEGHASVFRNELAAWSWNFLTFLVLSSCNDVSADDDLDSLECFKPTERWVEGRCSFARPELCRNVKGILSVSGLARNDVRANGNPRFGTNKFIWHSGGELVIDYARRNVFGFSMDFSEDVSKTNWGVEFTWVDESPFGDNDSFTDNTDIGALNLTVSVDRPTFINFLNANRTFFFNTQWFFNYLTDHNDGVFALKEQFNILWIFVMFTGYYQDRLMPQIVTVHDWMVGSGAVLPQVSYRFTEAFSVTLGVSFFFGVDDFRPMPVRGFAPAQNRVAGPHTYEDGVERLLTLVRNRDEAWLRVRWTF